MPEDIYSIFDSIFDLFGATDFIIQAIIFHNVNNDAYVYVAVFGAYVYNAVFGFYSCCSGPPKILCPKGKI